MLYSLCPTSAAAAYSHSASVGSLYSGKRIPEERWAYKGAFAKGLPFEPFVGVAEGVVLLTAPVVFPALAVFVPLGVLAPFLPA